MSVKAKTVHVTSTPGVIAEASLTGAELTFGPLNNAGLWLGGSDLETDGTHGWNAPSTSVFKLTLAASEKLYGVVPGTTAYDYTYLSTLGGVV